MVMASSGNSHAKIILIGEHSVVYHQPAIALPLPAVKEVVTLTPRDDGQQRLVSRYYTGDRQSGPNQLNGINCLIDSLLTRFSLQSQGFELTVNSHLPAERGMGSSAATAVAITRALYEFAGVALSHDQLLADAAISEQIIHGNPSGLDVATASANRPVWFVKGEEPKPIPMHMHGFLVIADSGIRGQTGEAVKAVATFRATHLSQATRLFNELGGLTSQARQAFEADQIAVLGSVFNRAQVLLEQLGVSHPKLDEMNEIARQNGAIGAKLTGGGMGGCMICLADTESTATRIRRALATAGVTQTWVQPFLSEETV